MISEHVLPSHTGVYSYRTLIGFVLGLRVRTPSESWYSLSTACGLHSNVTLPRQGRLSWCVALSPGKGLDKTTRPRETGLVKRTDCSLPCTDISRHSCLPTLELWLPSLASHMAFVFLNAAAVTRTSCLFFPLRDPATSKCQQAVHSIIFFSLQIAPQGSVVTPPGMRVGRMGGWDTVFSLHPVLSLGFLSLFLFLDVVVAFSAGYLLLINRKHIGPLNFQPLFHLLKLVPKFKRMSFILCFTLI